MIRVSACCFTGALALLFFDSIRGSAAKTSPSRADNTVTYAGYQKNQGQGISLLPSPPSQNIMTMRTILYK